VDKVVFLFKSSPTDGTRIEEGLRLSAAMVGMDLLPILIFVGDGVRCLLPDAFRDVKILDYLKGVSDLAGINVLKESIDDFRLDLSDFDPRLKAIKLGLGRLAELVAESDVTAAF
jgi:sulfur relay (sulfurtransferase) DsrF/TusC family protein